MSSTPCNTGRGREDINYEKSKKDFLKLAEQKLSNHRKYGLVYRLHTKRRVERIIAQKLEHPAMHAKYEVHKRDDKNILVVKRKATDSYMQVLSWEDMFDIFMPLHVRIGHRGKDMLKKEILIHSRNHNIEYRFPTTCLYYFRRVCSLCLKNNVRFSLLKASKTGVVHVIAMAQTRLEEKFRYMLIYADKETHYVILRPLTEKTSLEIGAELYKIFTQFGPPTTLHIHGYNSTLTEKIGDTLNEICPEFRIETEHKPARYELPAVVTDRIQSWMTKTDSLIWELGCFVVQAEMNNDPLMRPNRARHQPRCTPHSLYFHTLKQYSPTDQNQTTGLNQQTEQNAVTEQNRVRETAMTDDNHVPNQTTDQNDIEIVNILESDEEMQDVDVTQARR